MTLHLSVDRPAEGEEPVVTDTFLLEGWVWSDAGPPTLTVAFAGREAVVEPGGFRTDVSSALGIGPHRGYVATGAATGLPPGPLEVVVTARAPDGEVLERRRTVRVAERSGPLADRPRPYAGIPERLDPRLAPGSLTHAEHVARYRWASPLARDRDVLDAGCGVGYGSAILAAAGARSIVGVDAFAAAVLAAREQDRHGGTFLLGDLRELPLDDDSVDLVTCFEVIEHLVEQDQAVAELRRVLRPGGIVLLSTPVPGAVTVHNPHHVRELTGAQLHDLLRPRFPQVRLVPQYSAIASVIDAPRPALDVPPLTWTTGPVEEAYTLAVATDADGALPDLPPTGVLGSGMDIAGLISEVYATADEILRAQSEATAQRARAMRAESAYDALEQAHAELQELARVTHASHSWKLTRPLREAAVQLRGLRGRRP